MATKRGSDEGGPAPKRIAGAGESKDTAIVLDQSPTPPPPAGAAPKPSSLAIVAWYVVAALVLAPLRWPLARVARSLYRSRSAAPEAVLAARRAIEPRFHYVHAVHTSEPWTSPEAILGRW